MPIAFRTKAGRDFAAAMQEEDRLEAERAAAARRAFKEGFQRSRKGNLWRRWTDAAGVEVTLTVFRSPRDGFVYYCIAGPGGQRAFSSAYGSEQEALDALARLAR